MRIGLFATCIGETLFPEAARATVEVLERIGHEVVFPEQQTCCGQMHLNSGYPAEAARLAERFRAIFDGFESVVAPSSSCVGTLREHFGVSNVFELSELLVGRLRIDDVGARYPHRVTYHPTCHSLRTARVGEAPLQLLRSVRDLELVELPHAQECCGFGGTFAVKNADTSAAMLADKCSSIEETGAEYCTALDASCLLQIGGALSRRGATARPIHLAEILAST
ncbi:MAG: (Fe-S)-binding protein [Acidimicrobiales bacterium]